MEQKAKRIGKFNVIDIIAVLLILAVLAFAGWKLLSRTGAAEGYIVDAFDASRADFAAMGSSPEGPLYLSRVLHKTHLALDAQGTRAGAATVVEVTTGDAAPGRTVYLDRPFLYLLVDCETNLPLFIGAVRSLET